MTTDDINAREQVDAILAAAGMETYTNQHFEIIALRGSVSALKSRLASIGRHRPLAANTTPDWLRPTLQRLAGHALTASEIMEAAGYLSPTPHQARNTGEHMRALGLMSRKSCGKLLFDVPKVLPWETPHTLSATHD